MKLPLLRPLQKGSNLYLDYAVSQVLAQRRRSTQIFVARHLECGHSTTCSSFTRKRTGTRTNSSLARSTYFGNRREYESKNPLKLVRLLSSGTSSGSGKAMGKSSQEEAARQHKEIQNLFQQSPPSSAPPSQPPSVMSSLAGKEGHLAFMHQLREQQREQKWRQGIVNTVLSFLMVVLAAQGAKNGQERREAQEGRQEAEQALAKIRSEVRTIVDSDEFLSRLARDCVQASKDEIDNPDGRPLWRNWMLTRTLDQSSNEVDEARVERVVTSLRRSLAAALTSTMLSDEERERQEMEQLSGIALSAISIAEATASATERSVPPHLQSLSPPPEPSSSSNPTEDQAGTLSQVNDRSEAKNVFIL